MQMTVDRAIFITNIFADYHPEKHVELWTQFEKEVPASKRSGVYGADNLAYVKWLKEKKNPIFMEFIKEHVSVMTF